MRGITEHALMCLPFLILKCCRQLFAYLQDMSSSSITFVKAEGSEVPSLPSQSSPTRLRSKIRKELGLEI